MREILYVHLPFAQVTREYHSQRFLQKCPVLTVPLQYHYTPLETDQVWHQSLSDVDGLAPIAPFPHDSHVYSHPMSVALSSL